jgi:hypothetical protein
MSGRLSSFRDWYHVAFKSSVEKHAPDSRRKSGACFFHKFADEISTCGNHLLINFSHDTKSSNYQDNLTENFFFKKSLDTRNTRAYSPHPVAVLTGIVTGKGIGGRRGDATFEDSNRRLKLLPLTPQPKPKGLRRTGRQIRPGLADKNAKALAKSD